MKEFIAETGGRYTYSDDILNLQELASSMTEIFSACSNFIISGCEIEDENITPGYVWLNGKVRSYHGSKERVFPFYIYEYNSYESVTYANEENKKGRCIYTCMGSIEIPLSTDLLTGELPQYIEIRKEYAPRFIDKFIGKYALLVDSPFAKQTVKKDLIVAGNFTGEKNIESKTALSVVNETKGFALKNIVKASGDGSVGLYKSGLLVNEIVINTNGEFSLYKANQLIATFKQSGIAVNNFNSQSATIGSYQIGNSIENITDENDSGSVIVNYSGARKQGLFFRDFVIYDGRLSPQPLLKVEGKTKITHINGYLHINGNGELISIINKSYSKNDKQLTGCISWLDKNNLSFAKLGFVTSNNYDFSIDNTVGNLTLSTIGYIDFKGEVRIKGNNINNLFVNYSDFKEELKKKVSCELNKQLSTEDFTTELLIKLREIRTGNIENEEEGYALVKNVIFSLNKKISKAANLSDVVNKSTARANLEVYSKDEVSNSFLKISGKLQELVNLTAQEINDLTPEEAGALKASKQQAIREVLGAEKSGTGDLKLTKSLNLSDLPDKEKTRKNLGVYSSAQVDKLLSGYLPNSSEYKGVIFTQENKSKLEAISTGNFTGVDAENNPIPQKDGYVLVSHIIKELDKKANRLMDGYNESDRKTIASNLGLYTKTETDGRYTTVSELFQDYITYLVKSGKTTTQAQTILREKLNVLSKEDVTANYLRKDGKLSDLILPNVDAKKLACRTIGAAYADEYQSKLKDTGWLQMTNSGNTDTRRLFIRQIGNIVCIQGIVNTGCKNGTHWGGSVAYIPNQIDPPKYGLQTSAQIFNDDHKYNRGTTFVLRGGERNIVLYESGHNNQDTELNFTYMT